MNCSNTSQLSSRTGLISNGRHKTARLSLIRSFLPILSMVEAINSSSRGLHKTRIIRTSTSSSHNPISNRLLKLTHRSHQRHLPNQLILLTLGASKWLLSQASPRSHQWHLSRSPMIHTQLTDHHQLMEDSSQRVAMDLEVVITDARATSTLRLLLTSMKLLDPTVQLETRMPRTMNTSL